MDLQEYYRDPFRFVDNLSVKIRGTDLNVLKNHVGLRKAILFYSIVCTALWVVMGFDSTLGQLEWPVWKFLTGEVKSWADLVYWYQYPYGKAMHWSAFTIYGAMFVAISYFLESKLGLTRTKNTVYTFCFVLLNIALFEYFWMYGFAVWQNQPWVVKWAYPQLRILLQNAGFSIVGVLGTLYFYLDSFKLDENDDVLGRLYVFRPSMILPLSLVVTFASTFFWVNYGDWLPVESLKVWIEGQGWWSNTAMFPQTLYTIDTNLLDKVNAGEWFWVKDDLVHAVNTGVKALWALAHYLFVASWRSVE